MPSTFAWLDYDDSTRRRMMEVIDLFREKGTLDELGIGSIRDTLADCFFPGTSTIQTRVRYFIFIPWIYTAIERERIPSDQVANRARHDQHRLVESLKRGEAKGQVGIIGRAAGESLKRLPASIYWNGLGVWGIRPFPGSISQYGSSLNGHFRYLATAGASDTGELSEAVRRNWTALPPVPHAFLESTDFRLTQREAQFLSDQIWRHCERSLLATCLRTSRSAVTKAKACWDLVDLAGLDPGMRGRLEDARRFACLMEGAVLLYNLMLAEQVAERAQQSDSSSIERYRRALARWEDDIIGAQDDLQQWDLGAFETEMRILNPRISTRALDFCHVWMSNAIATPRQMADDRTMRALLTLRERQLKGGLARLSNARALENWSGESGLGLLDFRWGTAKPMVLDILDGLNRPSGSD